eukprot:13294498-Alexandrium_andersonii.AAC.1
MPLFVVFSFCLAQALDTHASLHPGPNHGRFAPACDRQHQPRGPALHFRVCLHAAKRAVVITSSAGLWACLRGGAVQETSVAV